MPENEIRPGESIAQWKARISSQAKAKQEDENWEIEQQRRRLANASGEEYFEEIPTLTFTSDRYVSPLKEKLNTFEENVLAPLRAKINNLGVQFRFLMQDPIVNGRGWIQRHVTGTKEETPVDIFKFDNTDPKFKPGYNEEPYFAVLRDSTYGGVRPIPHNANSILFNDFVNDLNPHIHTAREWKRMSPETRLKDDKSRKLKDIKYFGGVENGTFKVMPLSEFNDTTVIIPNYFVDAEPVVEIAGLPEQRYREAMNKYEVETNNFLSTLDSLNQKQNEEEEKIRRNIDSTYQHKFFGDYDKNTDFYNRATNLIRPQIDTTKYYDKVYGFNDNGVSLWDKELDDMAVIPYSRFNIKNIGKIGRTANNVWDIIANAQMTNPEVRRLAKQSHNMWNNQPVEPVKFEVVSMNGQREPRFRGMGANKDKYVLGNASGSYFMERPETIFEMYPQYLDTLKNAIDKTGPLIPFMVDQGAYNDRYWPLPDDKSKAENEYNKYQSPNLYKLGTISRKQGGTILKFKKGKHLPLKYPDWKDGDSCPTDECAFFANSMSRDYFGVDTYGNAWTLNGEPLYTNKVSRPINSSKNSYFKYLHDSADKFASDFDFSQLNPDEVYQVNMYYNGSPSWYKAEPTGNGTHAGYLEFKNGQWNVVHNIHGKVHVDALNDILGGNQKSYGVLNIYRAPGFNRKDAYKQQLDSYVLENPMGIWTEDSANVRNWLRKNSPETLQNYWNNLTDEQRKKVDRRFRP